jgi:hypothetical protein
MCANTESEKIPAKGAYAAKPVAMLMPPLPVLDL